MTWAWAPAFHPQAPGLRNKTRILPWGAAPGEGLGTLAMFLTAEWLLAWLDLGRAHRLQGKGGDCMHRTRVVDSERSTHKAQREQVQNVLALPSSFPEKRKGPRCSRGCAEASPVTRDVPGAGCKGTQWHRDCIMSCLCLLGF